MDRISDPTVVVHSAESRLKSPRVFWARMRKDLAVSWEIAACLLARDIAARYRQSFLGIFWAFIPPVVAAVGLTIANNAEVIRINTSAILPYPVYVMFSMALWGIFAEAVNAPTAAISAAKGLLARVAVPPEAVVLSKLGDIFFNFSINLVLIAALFLVFRIPPGPSLLWAPLGLVNLVLLGLCVGLWIMPLGVLYQDFLRLWKFLMAGWFFLTPVIYAAPDGGWFSVLVQSNPTALFLDAVRNLALGRPIENPVAYAAATLAVLAGVFTGWVWMRVSVPYLIERGGA